MLTFDMRDFSRFASRVANLEKQLPFAFAQALNASADIARRELIDTTWSEHVHVRNPRFLNAALTSKGARATKKKLRVEVYDKLGRASLNLHDSGGTKAPRGSALAIPTRTIGDRRGAKGVPKGLRPRNLSNSFAKTGKSGDTMIFQRTGSYKKAGKVTKSGKQRLAHDSRGLRLAYVLKSTAPVQADVPFQGDFARSMRRLMPMQFRISVGKAVATAFRK